MPLIRDLPVLVLALDPVPDAWQTGWRGLTVGLVLMGIFWLAFEAGYYAGTQEERAFWAPLEAPPRKWPRLLRSLLRLEHLATRRHAARQARQAEQERADLLRHSGGRHRTRLEPPGGVPPVAPSGPEHVSGPARQHRDREAPG